MKKILGIIAEYNPFHNGHLEHLSCSKELLKPDYTICIMSGNFVQRGEPALLDKWTRAENAVLNGFDLVIELPTIYAISSAENFARGSISILNELQANYLSFGSECGDINTLNKIANFLVNEPADFKSQLSSFIQSGDSFAEARAKAISSYFEKPEEVVSILQNSNNILGIEYLKMLLSTNSSISPITIKRSNPNYNSNSFESKFPSATAIRNAVFQDNIVDTKVYVPNSTFELLQKAYTNNTFVNLNNFEKEILYCLSVMSFSDLIQIPDVDEPLANLLISAIKISDSLEGLIQNTKTKYYTRTRIQRVLLYILLQIHKEDMELSKSQIPYCKVLAFNPEKKEVFSVLKEKNPKLNFIFSASQFLNSSENEDTKNLLKLDIKASKVYSLALPSEFKINDNDFTKHF